jgi:hypothetical protein
MPPTPPLADSYHPLNAAAPAEASRNETRSFYVFSRAANCGCTIRYTNTLRFNSINWTHLSRAHSSMGSACLVVEDLQSGRELEG